MVNYFQNKTLINDQPPVGLFDRIIAAINHEKEIRKTRKIFFGFVFLLVASILSVPFSSMFLMEQWNDSGTIYFISIALHNFNSVAVIWQDFAMSLIESIPVIAIILFAINIILVLFTIRLFIYKKGLLLKYLMHSI